MKAQSIASHPLVKNNQTKVLESAKQKRIQPNDEAEQVKPKGHIKKENAIKKKK